jgi:hypothetical protein
MSLCLSFIASLVMHSVTWLSHRKSRTSPNSIPRPLYLFCASYSLNTTYFRSFVSSLALFYFKFILYFCEKEMSGKEKKRKEKNEWMIWRGWIKWRINKVHGRGSRCCWETKLPFFFQPCAIRQRGRHQCLVVLFSFALAHVHHSVSFYPWYPYIMV